MRQFTTTSVFESSFQRIFTWNKHGYNKTNIVPVVFPINDISRLKCGIAAAIPINVITIAKRNIKLEVKIDTPK